MRDPVSPRPKPERRPALRNWVLLALLAALAAFLYVSVMVKFASHGS
jgi:hypothetical protein